MQRLFSWVLLINMSGATIAYAEPGQIEGYWQHEVEPLVVQMRAASDNAGHIEGVVVSHALKSQAVGKTLFNSIVYNSDKKCWEGYVYVARLEKNKAVCLLLN